MTEKKLLQSKLRKASTAEKSADVSKSQNLIKKNASTSTEDLGMSTTLFLALV